jgi:hypothetical protein
LPTPPVQGHHYYDASGADAGTEAVGCQSFL